MLALLRSQRYICSPRLDRWGCGVSVASAALFVFHHNDFMNFAGRAVLGLDAAWTPEGASGVALVKESPQGTWSCVAVAAGYEAFIRQATGDSPRQREASLAERLVAASRFHLAGATPSLVTVDMPVSLRPITRRRTADDEVSQAFGRAKCGTHSPSTVRPGAIADELRAEFAVLGFPLATAVTPVGTAPSLIEVYPHPALLTLCGLSERLPYKVAKARSYWPVLAATARAERLVEQFAVIVRALEARGITGIPSHLRTPSVPATPGRLKAVEDQIDALVCAWVGVEYLSGSARAYGDADAAIWIPKDTTLAMLDSTETNAPLA
jgi:predicted RNase H-like nuclease